MEKNDIEKNMNKFVSSIKGTINQTDEIKRILKLFKLIQKKRGIIFTCGNGGSSANASHFASDLFLTSEIKAICLNDNISIYSALINDKGWSEVYLRQLMRFSNPTGLECLVVFSVHGGVGKQDADDWSVNLNKVIDYAKLNKIKTVGFSGATGGYFNICDYNIIVDSLSTPIVEGIHSVLSHLIAFMLVRDDI